MVLKGYILGIGYALCCLLLSFVVYKLGLPKKYTRKIVHVLVGFEWVILYHYIGSGVHFLSICILFLLLLLIAYKGRLMPMISSDDDNAPGTVYYAVAMTGVALIGCFAPNVMLPFGIGVMCTSVGDGLAGIVGQLVRKGNPKIYGNKTILGSFTNFAASSVSAIAISCIYSFNVDVIWCVLIGVLSSELELIAPKGLDNISITWGVTAFAYAAMHLESFTDYLLPVLLTPVIIIFVISKRALTRGGLAGAVVLDIAVSAAFGNCGFIVLSSFFMGAIVVDKIKDGNKRQGRVDIEEKSDRRDIAQVLANGGVAFVFAVIYICTGYRLLVIPFVASLAEAFSDTVASGMGVFAKRTYDPFRRCWCEKGLSGGMSLPGTMASFAGAIIITLIAMLIGFVEPSLKISVIIIASAFIGAIVDSALGSLVQAKYRCSSCDQITEKKEHCGTATSKCGGIACINNDVVNALSCAFSAVCSLLMAMIF